MEKSNLWENKPSKIIQRNKQSDNKSKTPKRWSDRRCPNAAHQGQRTCWAPPVTWPLILGKWALDEEKILRCSSWALGKEWRKEKVKCIPRLWLLDKSERPLGWGSSWPGRTSSPRPLAPHWRLPYFLGFKTELKVKCTVVLCSTRKEEMPSNSNTALRWHWL